MHTPPPSLYYNIQIPDHPEKALEKSPRRGQELCILNAMQTLRFCD